MLNGKLFSLSLGSWPTEPICQKDALLTPITKKILKQVHLKLKDILPLTFSQFLQNNQYEQNRTQDEDQYHFQLQRRKKKIIILADIRNKYIEGKDYNKNQQKTRSTIKEKVAEKIIKSVKPSEIYCSGEEKNENLLKLSTKSRNLSRISQKKILFKSPLVKKKIKSIQNSDEINKLNSFSGETESKAEKPKKTQRTETKKITPNPALFTKRFQTQYYDSSQFDRINRLKSLVKKDSDMLLCKQLIKTIQKWSQLDSNHMRQLSKIRDYSPKQMQRLSKMQSIEKKQMRNRIKRIKSRFDGESY